MVQWVIAEVMADHELEPDNVANEYRRHSVYGWGAFRCEECRVSWTSQITWATIDIKEQCIKRRFKQKCRSCEKPQRPWWHIQEFAYMVEFALNRYQKLVAGKWRPSARASKSTAFNPPHKSEYCERCGFGKAQCWIASQTNKQQPDTAKPDLEEKELDLKIDNGDEQKKITSEENVKPRRTSETKVRPRRQPKSASLTENDSDAHTKSENESVQPVKKPDKAKQGNQSNTKRKSESEPDAKTNSVSKPVVKARPRRRSERTSRSKSESDEKQIQTSNKTENDAEKESSTISTLKSPSGENESEKSRKNQKVASSERKSQVNRSQSKSESDKTPRKNESGQKTPRRREPNQKTPRKSENDKPARQPDSGGKKPQIEADKLVQKSESSERGSPTNKAEVKQRKSEPDEILKSEMDEAEKENAAKVKSSGNSEIKAKPQRPGRFTRRNTPKRNKVQVNGKNSGEESSAANAELSSKEAVNDNLGRTAHVTANGDVLVESAVSSEVDSALVSEKLENGEPAHVTANGDVLVESAVSPEVDSVLVSEKLENGEPAHVTANGDVLVESAVSPEVDSALVSEKLENGEPGYVEDDASSVVEIKCLFENDNASAKVESLVNSLPFENGEASSKEDVSSIVEIGFLFESSKVEDEASASTTENLSVLEITTFEQLAEIQVE